MRYMLLILFASYLPENVQSFDFLREIISPKKPHLNRVRNAESARSIDQPYVLDFIGLVEKHGYPGEEHNLTTEDGYNIVLHRIPGSVKSPGKIGKPVIFLQHGIAISSDSWVLIGPQSDLAFILADEGYDVWLGNVRGNSYCRSHQDLSPSDEEFWKFSYHEMALYDLPKMIDHALSVSKQKTMVYIGHSMGTTMSYVLLSTKPEYNKKISLLVSLAPIAFWNVPPRQNLITWIRQNSAFLTSIFQMGNINELFPQTSNNARLANVLCSDQSITQSMCMDFIFSIVGADPDQFNSTIIPYLMSHFPSGVSLQTLLHYLQNIQMGAFQTFDYGYVENFKNYHNKKPLVYDIKKITAMTVLIISTNDPFIQEENVAELMKKLKNIVEVYKVPHDMFNHLDYLWARDVRRLLNDKIVKLLASQHKI